MSVRTIVVGVCMFTCNQRYWNGPMGLRHGCVSYKLLYASVKIHLGTQVSMQGGQAG